MTAAQIAARLVERGLWRSHRAPGPGGQHRDTSRTAVVLTIEAADIEMIDGLEPHVAQRLISRLALDRAPLRLVGQTERLQGRNRSLVRERLEARIEAALAPPPPPRRPTRPSRAARQRRLSAKARRSQVKADRRRPRGED